MQPRPLRWPLNHPPKLHPACVRACTRTRTTPNRSWLREYVTGCGYNIFEASVGPDFEAVPFVEAAEWLYRVSGIVLIGARLPACVIERLRAAARPLSPRRRAGGTNAPPTQHAAATATPTHRLNTQQASCTVTSRWNSTPGHGPSNKAMLVS